MKSLATVAAMGVFVLIAFVPLAAVVLAVIGFVVVLFSVHRTSGRADAIAQMELERELVRRKEVA